MKNEVEYKNIIAFHPGSYVEEIVDDLNITQFEFANRLGVSDKTVSKIINGEERISNDTANKLSKLTGISLKTWLNLQSTYDEKLIEIEEQKNNDEKDICKLIDIASLKKNKFINSKKRYSISDKIKELRKLMTMSNLTELSCFNSLVSYRRSTNISEKSIINSNVMLEIATNMARNVTTNKYRKNKLLELLPKIRKMILDNPDSFYPDLKNMLLECGIVLVALPSFKGAGLNGATKKFKNGSVLLLITDRRKDADIFWFTLMHEIGHIYYDDFHSDIDDMNKYDIKEKKANEFSSDFLIPHDEYENFLKNNKLDVHSVKLFAKSIGILPGIVVGRLQNDNLLEYNEMNSLKERYSVEMK